MIAGRGISFQSAMLIPKEPLQNRRQKTLLLLPNGGITGSASGPVDAVVSQINFVLHHPAFLVLVHLSSASL